ncbi:MAG: hypothetical protein ABR571_12290 [Jatrophihabitans sp.]|uniref:hypothetical protein n=1 Tax=Jatrophihabitans sp. TaxID=1932789 RepID=UPI003911B330
MVGHLVEWFPAFLTTATGLRLGRGPSPDADPVGAWQVHAGTVPIEELLRSSGQYEARVPVPADADAQTRLLGFIGRDPLAGRD